MKVIILLVMHGVTPRDFPREELTEFSRLHSGIGKGVQRADQERYLFLENKIRYWPRNQQSDPSHTASQELAAHFSEVSGYEVILGYNEFCAPSFDEVLQSVVNKNVDKIIVATPMMTRGGDRAEKDIPVKIEEFRERYPKIEIVYAWPFDTLQVARFLSKHISRFF
jgi:sirohydrochlorin cobaltochelatase